MNRIDRLSAILIQLQSKKVVKAQEIADRFEISLRTVYRDIRALEEAGVPIGAEAGVGYFIDTDFHLPPVMFTRDEASAFLLAEKLMDKLSDEKVCKSFEAALFKVKSVLNTKEKEYLEKLTGKITVFNRDPLGNSKQNLFLTDIQTALAKKQVIRINYKANYNKQLSKREVEPVSLCNYDMNWHLIAYCRLRSDYRDFRLDRIQGLELLQEPYSDVDHISLNEYFKRMTLDNSLYTIELRVCESIHSQMASSKYWFGLVEEKQAEKDYYMKFANNDLQLFGKWVLSLEDKVEILSPLELKEIVVGLVKKLSAYHK